MHDCSLRVIPGIFNAIHTDQYIETTYMRLGHGPGGATGLTINEPQMTVWALSFANCGEIVSNLVVLSKGEMPVFSKHKEESAGRIKCDQSFRSSIREYLSRDIDP